MLLSLEARYNALMDNSLPIDERLLCLWGKSDERDTSNYHPLLFHLLDVGFCARFLWREGLSSLARARLAAALHLPEDAAEQVCTLLAAQHDLGKASAFQLKPSVPRLPDNVRAAGFNISPAILKEQPHGFVSAYVLPLLARVAIGGWQADMNTARLLAKVTGGHHGAFPLQSDLTIISEAATLGGAGWDDARSALLRRTQQILFPDTPPVAVSPLDAAALVPLVGGFVSVADWLGSSKSHFQPAAGMTVAGYALRSEKQARETVRDFGWSARPQFAAPSDFSSLFCFSPNPMQQIVAERARTATGSYLMIVEAAMGEGKTEAALYAVDQALATHKAEGFFLALPTQATGNAMFGRVLNDYLKQRAHGGTLNVQLVHAGSWNSDVFDALQVAATTAGPTDQLNRIVAQQWFTHKKQALLAPFGVGTIDQCLLGVLQTRHWFVRLFGLAGKVVVFDEVHAYDVYMGTILARLLPWLRSLGCTVVLLSATLPRARREELTSAWDALAIVPEAAYPRVTFVAEGRAESVHVVQETAAPKDVMISYATPDLEGLVAQVKHNLPDGGCAAVICNTVGRAQKAYLLLRDVLAQDGWDVTLFHARTLANWRAGRETTVLTAFGKQGPRPRKAVMVATQVAEQSLDLDFDWMASDMAPADLLLQRLGRLWRHPRPNRPITRAGFLVLCGERSDGLPIFPENTDVVYDEHILLRSRHFLRAGVLHLPGDIDPLVQDVYAAAEPEGMSAAWRAALGDAKQKHEAEAAKSASNAENVVVRSPHRGAAYVLKQGESAGDVLRDLYDDDDPQVHRTLRAATREGDPSLFVVCTGTAANEHTLAPPPATTPRAKDDYKAHAKAARTMLGFAVSISHQGLFHRLKSDAYAPVTWKDSPLLRYHRSLDFDNGTCDTVPGFHLHLSLELGLMIETTNTDQRTGG